MILGNNQECLVPGASVDLHGCYDICFVTAKSIITSLYFSESGSCTFWLIKKILVCAHVACFSSANSSEGPEKRSSSEDLKQALRRLSLRRQNCLSERRFFEEARERRHHDAPLHGIVSGESIMSLGVWPSRPYLPDKLQIVKPLEGEKLQPLWVKCETFTKGKTYHVDFFLSGSVTLQQWQQLAQPNLGGILDTRPGVVPKGFRPLELDLEEVYHYSDFEEDEPGEQYFQNLPTTTTLANPGLGHAPSASPSPCLSTGHASAEFSGGVTVVQ